jgi:hypothetical protein
MNVSDLVAMVEPALGEARTKVTSLRTCLLERAKLRHAHANPATRIVSGLAAGVALGKLVSSLGR